MLGFVQNLVWSLYKNILKQLMKKIERNMAKWLNVQVDILGYLLPIFRLRVVGGAPQRPLLVLMLLGVGRHHFLFHEPDMEHNLP